MKRAIGGENKLNTLVSIITVCVTLLLGIIGIIVNTTIQRKSNSIKIITQTRLERRMHTQNLIADLLKLSDPHYIGSISCMEERYQIAKEAVRIASDLRTRYCFYMQQDVDLIESVFNVKDILCNVMLEKVKISEEKLIDARKALAYNVDVYTSTEWKRIKLETVGKEGRGKAKIDSWQSIYSYYSSHFLKDENEKLFKV